MNLKVFFLSVLVMSSLACSSSSPKYSSNRNPASDGTLGRITDDDYQALPRVGNFRPVKFVFTVTGGKPDRLTVIDPRVHSFHWQYLASTAEFRGAGFQDIQKLSFKKENRRFYLGIMMPGMHTTESNWDFRVPIQFSTEEIPAIEDLKVMMPALKDWIQKSTKQEGSEVSEFFDNVAYQPLEDHKASVKANVQQYIDAGIEVKLSLDVGVTQVYSFGWGVGKLKAFEKAQDLTVAVQAGSVNQGTILVVNADVLELPPVAGIISAKPLTEASHLVLLAQMYGIPLVYQKDIFQRMKVLENQNVFLQTTLGIEDSFGFSGPLSDEQVANTRKLRPVSKLKDQVIDWNNKAIVPVEKIADNQVGSYGGKATKFGLIKRTIPQYTRSVAIGIPVSYYRRFMNEAKTASGKVLGSEVKVLLSQLPANASYADVTQKAGAIRELIKASVVPDSLIQEIRKELISHFPSTDEVRLKIRSSSNVEDGAEFNGAGLYESEGVCLSNCKKKDDFAKGLVKVWGSLFTARGYWARKQFGVVEENVGMGLLAHAPYKGELFNGVVRFKVGGSYNPDEKVCDVLGVQGEESSITNTDQGGGNERVRLYDGDINEVRALKGAPAGRLMMSEKSYKTLCEQMANLHKAWPFALKDSEIEAEWKLMEGGPQAVQIKQVRMVPRPKLYNLAEKQVAIVTPTTWSFGGEWEVPISSTPDKADYLWFRTSGLTHENLMTGKVTISDVKIRQRGKDIVLQASAPKRYIGQGSGADKEVGVKFVLTAVGQPDRQLSFALPVIKGAKVLSASDFGVKLSSTHLFPLYSEQGFLIYDKKNEKVGEYENEKETCAVKMDWTSSERWVGNDNEFRVLENVQIKGLLPRPLHLAKQQWPVRHLRQHEGLISYFFDLLSDPSLTDGEKAALNKMGGRYLFISSSDGKFHLMKSKNEKGKPVKGCGEDFEDDRGQNDGAE